MAKRPIKTTCHFAVTVAPTIRPWNAASTAPGPPILVTYMRRTL